MNNIQKAFFTCRVARAPELKYTTAGMAVAKLSIVCNRSKKKGDEWEDEPNFYELTAWGKTAEHLSDKCVKGQKMTFDCEVKQERWDDRDTGKPQSRVSFIVNTYEYGEKPRGAQDGQGGYQPQTGSSGYTGYQQGGLYTTAPAQHHGGYTGDDNFPEDIPF